MAFNFNAGMASTSTDLAYDLRQTYAKIVGDHLEDIAEARKANQYHIYYKCLNDLYIVTKHNFSKKDDEDKKTDDQDKYSELLKEVVAIANKYPNEWLGEGSEAKACAEIEAALNKIEIFLYQKLHKANMFGSNKKLEGL